MKKVGGVLVEWGGGGGKGGVVFHCLEFWLAGGGLVGFSNGGLMEFSITSTEVLFGSSIGVSLTVTGV